jgi:hypothetical protein
VLVANDGKESGAKNTDADYVVESCQPVSSNLRLVPPDSAQRAVAPILRLMIAAYRSKGIDLPDYYDDDSVYKNLVLLEPPKHGYLEASGEYGMFGYFPDTDYVGDDSATFMVEYKGERYKIIVQFEVAGFIDECPPHKSMKFIKVKKSVSDVSDYDENIGMMAQVSEVGDNDPANWYYTTFLQSFLTNAKAALTGFTDLSGASLGQTTGEKITLDADAAGHGWFIDYTPYLNEEWLATSNPYEWKAKPNIALQQVERLQHFPRPEGRGTCGYGDLSRPGRFRIP